MFSVKEILIGCESMRFLFCERTTSGMREAWARGEATV